MLCLDVVLCVDVALLLMYFFGVLSGLMLMWYVFCWFVGIRLHFLLAFLVFRSSVMSCTYVVAVKLKLPRTRQNTSPK
jgi:hypothetical protein